MSFVVERSSAARVALDVMARRARTTLRFERGRIYDVTVDYEPLNATVAHCTIGADCQPEHGNEVRAEFLDVFDAVSRDGATEAEIEREVNEFIGIATLPAARMGFLDGEVWDHLVGHARNSPRQIIDEYRATNSEATAAAIRNGRDTLLVLGPLDHPDGRGLKPYPGWSSSGVSGREYRPPGLPFGRDARKDRLIVGSEGVSWRVPDGNVLTVRYDQCVAVQHWDPDVRELWGADGFRVRIAAADWRNGAEALRTIDAAVDPILVACGVHGLGGLGPPARGS